MSCTKFFTTEADFTTGNNFSDYPPYFCPPDDLTGYADLGTRIMEEMLLTQYINSPNLKEYILAFVEEMDILLEEIHKVELGRYLTNAEGVQLDIIGVILQQSRGIKIDEEFFGFDRTIGALSFDSISGTSVGGFSDAFSSAFSLFGTETEAGFFRSIGDALQSTVLLDDDQYRRVLAARGYAVSEPNWSVPAVYEMIEIALGYIPNYIEVVDSHNKLILKLSDSLTALRDVDILNAISHWFTPMGTVFTIDLI